MSFRVRRKQNMARNIRRLLKSQVDVAIEQLERFRTDPSNTVHEARIAFKRIRTLLHLLKKALDRPTYTFYNQAFRDLGLKLSSQRDNWVKQQAIHALREAAPSTLTVDGCEVSAEDEMEVQEVLQQLHVLHGQLGELRISPKGFKLVKKTARKIYRDGQAAMSHVRETDRDEAFHEWRKNAKHLYHFVALLQPVQMLELKPLRDELYDLTQLLGDDHDLSLLKADAVKNHDQALYVQISQQQKQMRVAALSAGEKLYGEAADEFLQRMESYWKRFRGKQESMTESQQL